MGTIKLHVFSANGIKFNEVKELPFETSELRIARINEVGEHETKIKLQDGSTYRCTENIRTISAYMIAAEPLAKTTVHTATQKIIASFDERMEEKNKEINALGEDLEETKRRLSLYQGAFYFCVACGIAKFLIDIFL